MGLGRFVGLGLGYAAHGFLRAARSLTDAEIEGQVGRRVRKLAYAENRWQGDAFLYRNLDGVFDPFAHRHFRQIAGLPTGFINETDLRRLVVTATHIGSGFFNNTGTMPLMCIGVKHGNVSGAGVGDDPVDVVKKMIDGDPEAIFGGYVLVNFSVTLEIAEILRKHRAENQNGRYVTGKARRPFDGIIARQIDADAIEYLKRKDERCRMIIHGALWGHALGEMDRSRLFSQVRRGFMTQGPRDFVLDLEAPYMERVNLEPAEPAEVTEQRRRDLVLGWAVGSTANSNTIVLARDDRILSVAVGNQSRVIAAIVATLKKERAGCDGRGFAAYSDSFFPYLDAIVELRDKGLRSLLTSSGPNEVKNQAVRDFSVANGITLYMGPDAKIRGFAGHGA